MTALPSETKWSIRMILLAKTKVVACMATFLCCGEWEGY